MSTSMFLRQARRDFQRTGAIAPSSRFLARAICGELRRATAPVRVLEAGAGTGALTGEIIASLPDRSSLDIYELNPVFAEHLREAYAGKTGEGRRATERGVAVRVHTAPVQSLPDGASFDYVVSGLPLNNFDKALVKALMARMFEALRVGGVLSYFEYLLIRELKSLATGPVERRRLRSVGRVTGQYLRKYEFRRESVLLNIPPAVVHFLRRPA